MSESFTINDLENYLGSKQFNNYDEEGQIPWGELNYLLPKQDSGKTFEVYQPAETGNRWGSGQYVPGEEFFGGLVRIADDTETGGEGSQEDIHLVLSVTPDDGGERRYFRKEGYYASYDGSNWDGAFAEVYPYEVSVTRWSRTRQ